MTDRDESLIRYMNACNRLRNLLFLSDSINKMIGEAYKDIGKIELECEATETLEEIQVFYKGMM